MKTEFPTTFPDWTGTRKPAPQVKGKLCDARPDLGVRLIQQSKNRFAVTYCLHVKTGMNYTQAATEYGACIMHALACGGLIEND